METIDLGGARLHLLVAHRGIPGEADRLVREVARLAPVVLLADVGTDEGLRLREAVDSRKPFEPHFVDALFASESARRFAGDAPPGEDALIAVAREARVRRIQLVPMRGAGGGLGLFARSRARRAAAEVTADTPDAFASAYGEALRAARAWDPSPDASAMQARAVKVLEEGRAPVVALVQAHRAPTFRGALLQTRRVAP